MSSTMMKERIVSLETLLDLVDPKMSDKYPKHEELLKKLGKSLKRINFAENLLTATV